MFDRIAESSGEMTRPEVAAVRGTAICAQALAESALKAAMTVGISI
jgi:hypothetical protein